jgi:23S rRNA (uracil1939-C5)-methyltransferase
MPTPHEAFELTIRSVAFGGDGVARLPDGRVVFVPFTLPGERVRARVVPQHRRLARARVEAVLEAPPGRVDPPCPYFQHCGGCQYQHASYPAELACKQAQVGEVLQRIGGVDPSRILPVIPSPEPYGYRNRITLHQHHGRIGFLALDNRTVIDIQQCLLAGPEVREQMDRLRAARPPFTRRTLFSRNVPGPGFFQNNRFLLDRLQQLVADALRPGGPMLIEGYAGTGWLSRAAAPCFEKILGVESDARAVAAAAPHLPAHVQLLHGRCEDLLPRLLEEHAPQLAAVLVDPPRTGLPAPVRQALAGCPARRLAYLSCQPATLARDLRDLTNCWNLESVQPVDLFPRTAHIECLAVLSRRA